jgi:O-antigen chain-terminating methyltransferase
VLDTFEIRDEEINVEEIMKKIRENIKRRKETGAYPDIETQNAGLQEEHGSLCQRTKQAANNGMNDLSTWADNLKIDLDYINSNWDIQNNSYFISSHRPYAGKFLIKGRELVHGEVKRYVDPMIWKQKEFNASVARTLNGITKEISELTQREVKEDIDKRIRTSVDEQIRTSVDEQIGLVRSEIKNEISTQVSIIMAAMNQDIENKAWLANILDKKNGGYQNIETSASTNDVNLNYFLFEERFRGSRADIKQRQTAFVHYFDGCKNVLDIGCGRGEFLELLQSNNIGGHGIDADGNMIDFCASKGLNVVKIDAISYLEKIEDKSLDGIFIDQVVEHLEPDYLIKMLQLCYKKLNFGYYILIETVNPLSVISFVNFYIDLSHKKPIHPETLKFLLASVNFREICTNFFSLVPDEMRLRKINIEGAEEKDRHSIEVYNHNIDKLNDLLYGAQDYIVIAKK